MFYSLAVLVSGLLEDHLPSGVLDNPNEQLVEETKSVPNYNTISERDFAKLDRLLREKPNALKHYCAKPSAPLWQRLD